MDAGHIGDLVVDLETGTWRGVICGKSQGKMVVASANGHLATYGQLSNFLTGMAAFCLGQKHAGDSYQNCNGEASSLIAVSLVGCHRDEETRSLRRM